MERLTKKVENKYLFNLPSINKNMDKWNTFFDEIVEKLGQYEDAEEQGLMLRLPVSIGSKLWYINGKFILEYEVVGYSVDRTGAWLIYVEHYADEMDKTYAFNIDVDNIGKTAFLKKAEAEQKLKELSS